MGWEYYLKFRDASWYEQHRGELVGLVRQLPSYVGQKTEDEFWLKTTGPEDSWGYDIRIILKRETVLVLVSGWSQAFYRDVKALLSAVSRQTDAELVDDDGEVVNLLEE